MTSILESSHPRLFFNSSELAELRAKRQRGLHGQVWRNIEIDADWCLSRPHRTEWIAPVADDPIYENLYDRFYGMMHDMGIAEHLAFAAAFGQEPRHLAGAREWARSLAKVWTREAEGAADTNKAYAATRVLKGMAVAYDVLHPLLDDADRALLRDSIAAILSKYVAFFSAMGDSLYSHEPHHASVEAASLTLAALAIVGEVEGSEHWLDFCVRWHTRHLFENSMTPSGTHNQTSNFYISIMQYRIAVMDAVRRVTGRDLFKEFHHCMQSPMPLAAAVGVGRSASEPCAQTNQSWLQGPSYGQIDYASCVLVALAREYRNGVHQKLALWDQWLGGVQRSRYVSKRGDMMIFAWGGYAYAWLDETVMPTVAPETPLSFIFNDTANQAQLDNGYLHVRELYTRESFELGAMAAGFVRGNVCLHSGGTCLIADLPHHDWPPPQHASELRLKDDGKTAVLSMDGNLAEALRIFDKQSLTLDRPARSMRLARNTHKLARWWCAGSIQFDESTRTLSWSHGATLRIFRGKPKFDPRGWPEKMITGMGKLKLDDPMPCVYALLEIEPENGVIELEVRRLR